MHALRPLSASVLQLCDELVDHRQRVAVGDGVYVDGSSSSAVANATDFSYPTVLPVDPQDDTVGEVVYEERPVMPCVD